MGLNNLSDSSLQRRLVLSLPTAINYLLHETSPTHSGMSTEKVINSCLVQVSVWLQFHGVAFLSISRRHSYSTQGTILLEP